MRRSIPLSLFAPLLFAILLHSPLRGQGLWQAIDYSDYPAQYSLAIDSTGGFYVGTRNGWVLRSLDRGATWTYFDAGVRGYDVDIYASPRGYLLAVGSESFGDRRVLSMSRDSARSWTPLATGTAATFRSFAIGTDGAIYRGADGGRLLRSTDDGATWSESAVDANGTIGAIALDGGNRIVLAVNRPDSMLIARSSDQGSTWSTLHGVARDSVRLIAIDPDGRIFAWTAGEATACCAGFKLFRSLDGGATWEERPDRAGIYAPFGPKSVVAMREGIYTTLAGSLRISTDFGESFSLTNTLSVAVEQALQLYAGELYLLGNDYLSATANGRGRGGTLGTFFPYFARTPGSYPTKEVVTIVESPEGRVVGTLGDGIYQTMPQRPKRFPLQFAHWERVAPDIDTVRGLAVLPRDSIICAATEKGLLASFDDGRTWGMVGGALPGARFIAVASDYDRYLYAVSDSGLFVSSDRARTWSLAGNGAPVGLPGGAISILLTDGSGGHLYTVIDRKAYRSGDHGATWEPFATAIPADSIRALTVATPRKAPNPNVDTSRYIVLGTDKGIFISTDDGATWQARNEGLGELEINAVALMQSGYLVAGTRQGSYSLRLDDPQRRWELDRDGLGGQEVSMLYAAPSEAPAAYTYGSAYIGTPAGLFFWLDGETVSIDDAPRSPAPSPLPHPNPFGGTLTFGFTLERGSEIEVGLYSPLGELVTTVARGRYEAGHHEILWNAGDLPSGTYLYRLRADGGVFTGTVVRQ